MESTTSQFDDAELLDIDKKIHDKEKAYLTFHGARMYMDAARLKVYQKSGAFPNLTITRGLESLKPVIEEDTKFPATRDELLQEQGWKVFDLTENEGFIFSILLT